MENAPHGRIFFPWFLTGHPTASPENAVEEVALFLLPRTETRAKERIQKVKIQKMNSPWKIAGIACLSTVVLCSGCWFGSDDDNSKKASSAPAPSAPKAETQTVVGEKAGDLKNKVSETLGENTADKSETTELSVGDVNIDMEKIKAAIKTWQKDRWNADVIAKAKESKGKVSAADLKVQAQYKDLQPMFDLLVDDYVVYVNVLDSFVDASSVGEAVSQLMKAVSFDDMLKMAKDIGNIGASAKSIKDKAGWKDAVPIGKDMITFYALSASMTNASGILKSIFDQVVKK